MTTATNGQRYNAFDRFTDWFEANAFGGTSYGATPVGAVAYPDEPTVSGLNPGDDYYGLWALWNNFATCAWSSRATSNFLAVGDPLVKR